jgi:hypothetical protein
VGEAKWKAFIDGKKYGPVDEQTIQRWIDEQRITARTQIWCPGMTAWKPVAEIREFAAVFEATVAAVPALLDDPQPTPKVPAPAPPAPAPPAPAPPAPAPPAPAPVDGIRQVRRGAQVDHDAATVIRESPFAAEEQLVPVAKAGWATEQRVAVRLAAAPQQAEAAAARPGLPLLPILFTLLALLPAAALVYVFVVEGDPGALPVADRALLGGTAFGLLLLALLPLLYNGLGLWGGLLGALVALGTWGALLGRDLFGRGFSTRPRLLGLSWDLQERFIEGFSSGSGVVIAATALNWLALVVPFLALLYYAFTRKYRRRIRARA